MKKQLAKVIAAAMLAMLVIAALAACNTNKQVPVYQGMTVSNSPALYAYAGNGGGGLSPFATATTTKTQV